MEDIDIEEHDILDNPMLKTIFPDLAKLKREIYDDSYEVINIGQDIMDESHIDDTPANDVKISNSLLGEIRKEIVESASDESNAFRNNKIILGSKMSNTLQRKENSCKERKLYCAIVKLNNIRPYLDGCGKYCNICLILFPNTEDLNVHMQHLHSIKTTDVEKVNNSQQIENQSKLLIGKKPKCNICLKYFASISSLNKHKRNIHFIKTKTVKRCKIMKARNIALNVPNSNNNETRLKNFAYSCFHCDSIFPNIQSLIEHLYDTLQTTRGIKDKKFNDARDCMKKLKLHKEDIVNKTVILQKNKLKSTVQKINSSANSRKHVYRCPICSYYFNEENFSSTHLIKKHKFVKGAPLKKVLFEPKCKFCSSKFRDIKSYNCHIHKVHNKILTRTLPTKHTTNKTSKSIRTANEDINIIKNNIFVQKKPILKADHGKESSSTVPINNRFFKSALFKCNECNVHFLHSHDAFDHSSHLDILIYWKCSLCNQIFKKNDEVIHRLQHSFTNDFTVYGVCKYSIILYNCLKCGIHFDENVYLQHYPICEKVLTINHMKCKFCGILLDHSLYEVHNDYHKKKTNKTSSIIIIQTEVLQDNKVDEKFNEDCTKLRTRNIRATYTHIETQKLEINNMFKVYYCPTCMCFVHDGTKFKFHKKSLCTYVSLSTCVLCGLVITTTSISSHRRLHSKKKDLCLQDFRFYDMKCRKIIPPIPVFPHCTVCGVYFANLIGKRRHDCGIEEFVTCIECGKKFTELGYKLHMSYHNYRLDGKKISLKQYHSLDESKINSMKKKDMESITTKSTCEDKEGLIIFTCKNCHISLDNFDLVVEHCQGHYNAGKIPSLTKICKDCDLIFSAECFDSHKKLHSQKSNKVFFTFVKFDIFNFTSDYKDWIKRVFNSMPQNIVQRIINMSIYKYENRVKMDVIQEGCTDVTVYKCDKCNCFIDPSSLYRHLGNHCLKVRKHICRICEMSFISMTSKLQHEAVHLKPFKGVKSYRIVLFNREDDKDFAEVSCLGHSFTLYQCRNCDGIISKEDFKNHLCNTSDLKKCSYCGLLLYNKGFILHVSKHKEFESFNGDNIKVVLIGRKKEDGSRKMIINDKLKSSFKGKVYDYSFYKCKSCRICISDAKAIPKHNCSVQIPISKCSQCGLYLEAKKMKQHYIEHNADCNFVTDNILIMDFDNTPPSNIDTHTKSTSNIVYRKKEISDTAMIKYSDNCKKKVESGVIEKTVKLYKCPCGLHFLDNSFTAHLNFCQAKKKNSRQQCSKCGLSFSPNVLFKHLSRHHGNKNISYIFDIIQVEKNSSLPL